MRHAGESEQAREQVQQIGELRLVTMTTPKSWERYGIHAQEGVYPFLEPGGWESVVNTGTYEANIVHCRHESGGDVVLAAVADMYGAFGCLSLYGTKDRVVARFEDTFFAFKAQLTAFVDYLRTGKMPFAFGQTVELMKIIIEDVRRREEGGQRVTLRKIKP